MQTTMPPCGLALALNELVWWFYRYSPDQANTAAAIAMAARMEKWSAPKSVIDLRLGAIDYSF